MDLTNLYDDLSLGFARVVMPGDVVEEVEEVEEIEPLASSEMGISSRDWVANLCDIMIDSFH